MVRALPEAKMEIAGSPLNCKVPVPSGPEVTRPLVGVLSRPMPMEPESKMVPPV